jgi:oligopeptide/dipeptide ABC transporter ATP-binding protein
MSGELLLRVEAVSKHFGAGRGHGRGGEVVRALDEVTLTIDRHETVALVGESGSGKSTLARVVVRLVEPDAGRVMLGDESVLELSRSQLKVMRRRMQMVFQDPYSSLNPRRSIRSAIAEPALVHGRIGRDEEQAFVERMLDRVGLPVQVARRLPRELSGGQRQRVAIARALAVEPELLIADEAVSALDVSVQAQILNLFEGLREELGLTMLFISHQLPVVAHIADRVAVMYLGRIVELGTPDEVFASPSHPYTAALIAAQPGRQRTRPRIAPRPRVALSVSELQQVGCAYRDRCPLATEICQHERPLLMDVGGSQQAACHHVERTPSAVAGAHRVP